MEQKTDPVKVFWFSNLGTASPYDLNDAIVKVSESKYRFKGINTGGRVDEIPFTSHSIAKADVVILYYTSYFTASNPEADRIEKSDIKRMMERLAYARKEPVPVLVVTNKRSMELQEPVRESVKIEHGFIVETVSRSFNNEKDARFVCTALEDVMRQPFNLEGYFPDKYLTNYPFAFIIYLLMYVVNVFCGDKITFDKTADEKNAVSE